MSIKSWILTIVLAVFLYATTIAFVPAMALAMVPGSKPSQKRETSSEQPTKKPDLAPKLSFTSTQTRETPYFIEPGVISASLAALEKRGSDLSSLHFSTHQVTCTTSEAVKQISDWAISAEFQVSPPARLLLSGGVEQFQIDLVKTARLSVSSIGEQGRKISETAAKIPGVDYSAWRVAAVR